MQVEDIARIAKREFETQNPAVAAHFYAPEQILDLMLAEAVQMAYMTGVCASTLRRCQLSHVHGMEVHALPPGDYRILATKEPL